MREAVLHLALLWWQLVRPQGPREGLDPPSVVVSALAEAELALGLAPDARGGQPGVLAAAGGDGAQLEAERARLLLGEQDVPAGWGGGWGVVLVVCVCVGVGGVDLCRCVCVCDLFILLHKRGSKVSKPLTYIYSVRTQFMFTKEGRRLISHCHIYIRSGPNLYSARSELLLGEQDAPAGWFTKEGLRTKDPDVYTYIYIHTHIYI